MTTATAPTVATFQPDRKAAPRWPRTLLVICVYGALAAIAYFPSWPGDPSRLPICPCGDQAQIGWFLWWTPFAVAHLHNPLYSNFVDYSTGVNLAQNTLAPLLGLVSAPITALFGPVSATTFMLWLAITASASSCFLVLRRWVRWVPAAFAGGLFYGASPFMAGQSTDHLHQTFVPFPPLILLALYELVVRQKESPRKWGLILGVASAGQFLISPEILLTSGVMAAVGIVALALIRRHQVAAKAQHVVRGLAWAGLIILPIVAYPIYFLFEGTGHYVGAAHTAGGYPADLLGPLVPDSYQLLSPSSLATRADQFIHGDISENGSYLGIPMLLFLGYLVIRWWRVGWIRFAAFMALVAFVFSLGPRLTIDGHITSIRLPFDVVEHLPVFPGLIDARISLYTDLFVALMLAVGIDRWWERRHRSMTADFEGEPRHRRRHAAGRRRSAAGTLVALVVAAVVTVSVLPNWPIPVFPVDVPAYFSSNMTGNIAPGTVTLAYPYPAYPYVQAMLWQATDSTGFRLVGGYVLVANAAGQSVDDPFPPGPDAVPASLVADFVGGSPSAVIAGTPSTPPTPSQVDAFLMSNHVGAVVFQDVGANPQAAHALISSALGKPTYRGGGVEIWSHVGRLIRTHPVPSTAP
jgi:hypothetical protein